MTAVLSDQAVPELRHVMPQLVEVGLEQVRMQQAAMPQFYDLETLRLRWGNLGRDATLALLRTHAGYHGEPGKSPRIPLEQVLKIDDHLRAIYRARNAAPHVAGSAA
jgi:hypothetical protein